MKCFVFKQKRRVGGKIVVSSLVFLSVISLAADSPSPTPNSSTDSADWTETYSKAQKILGGDPTALLAGYDWLSGTKEPVEIKWAISGNKAVVREGDSGDARMRVFQLKPAQILSIKAKLQDSDLIKEIHDLSDRTVIMPDANYWILFVQMGKESVVLRSAYPDFPSTANLGPDSGPMTRCWAAIKRVFEPVLYPKHRDLKP